MILAIDVGNTNTVIGIFEGDLLLKSWRFATRLDKTPDEYGILIWGFLSHFHPDAVIDDIAISCVVPPVVGTLEEMSMLYFQKEAFFVRPGTKTGMPILYDNPQEVGADRIVNAVGVIEFYRVPAIVADFGTATTFDVISGKGEYLGGLIAPGLLASADGLYSRAARLPKVHIRKPDKVIGTNTVGSLQSGLYLGYVHLVRGIIREITSELGHDCFVAATGGLAGRFADDIDEIEVVDPDLTLKGLNSIFLKNRKS